MINYLQSEWYRLRKNRFIPILFIIVSMLIIAANLVLAFFGRLEQDFLYANTKFYYSNALAMSVILYIITFLLSSVLLGKDKKVIKVSVSAGVKRETIFFGKLCLSIIAYLVVGILLTAIMLLIGESTLTSPHKDVIKDLIISMVNMLPILLSAFILSFAFNLSNIKEANGFAILFVFYFFIGSILRHVENKHDILKYLYMYSPNGLLEKNVLLFMDNEARFMVANWIFGITVSLITIIISYHRFKKADL